MRKASISAILTLAILSVALAAWSATARFTPPP